MLYRVKQWKTQETRVDVRLVNNKKDYEYQEWPWRPSFVAQKIFDKNFLAVHEITTTLTLNKAAYVVIYILELSKVPMYELHYNYIKTNIDYYSPKQIIIHQYWSIFVWNWN